MTAWSLDKICEMTNNPEILNALHACRDGHPLNKIAINPWHNAAWLAQNQPSYVIPSAAIGWLLEQSRARKEEPGPRRIVVRIPEMETRLSQARDRARNQLAARR